VLARSALPDALWRQALASLPFLADYDGAETARLRELSVLFLDAKGIVGARGHKVTPLQRVVIAMQACVPVLNLDLGLYDGFENVIVYPDQFLPGWEWEDEAGVVHKHHEAMAGEAMQRGPVVLSWPDVAASGDWQATGMNLVIHEFAHKIDMVNGDADGFPPLPPDLPAEPWEAALSAAFADFAGRVDRDEETAIDPYAAENPGEFFAVLSEVFFADPRLLAREYPAVYAQFVGFYRQDPSARLVPGKGTAQAS